MPYEPGNTGKYSRLQLSHHEHVIWHIEFGMQAKEAAASKSEAGIVLRMTDNNDNVEIPAAAFPEPALDERGADPLPLAMRSHCHGTEPQYREARMSAFDRDRSKEDMTHDRRIFHGDQRYSQVAPRARGIHDSGLLRLPERVVVDAADRSLVARLFVPHVDRQRARILKARARRCVQRNGPRAA